MGKIFKVLGNLIVVLLILVCIPLAVPKVFGLQEYNVISGSMEPEIPVGALVYVRPVDFSDLAEGDVIAFDAGASVVTHRIVAIDSDNQKITTKGDANDSEDFMPVLYNKVRGRVEIHIPVFGLLAARLSEPIGKIVAVILLIVGMLLANIGEKKDGKDKSSLNNGINPKIILALGLVIIIGSMAGFGYIFWGYQKSNNLYESLETSYVQKNTGQVSWQEMIDVDIVSVQNINPDVIGWLYVEGTDISYPILYSGDDETYLRTTIDKEPATAGSIFLEGYNLPDWTDSHNIIYGHNMRNLSMFGSLKFYKSDDAYYDQHRYFQIITPEGKRRYEIFSYFDTEPASWVYTVPYSDSEEFGEYIKELNSHSYREILDGNNVSSKDQIITLSTCSASGMRFTVHGFLCDKE